jgi:hypothetical protein
LELHRALPVAKVQHAGVQNVKRTIFLLVMLVAASPFAHAQDANKPSPENGKKPSEILAMIEQRPDFARLDEMSWEEEGYYEITYRTKDKARVELDVDPSGKSVEQQ